MYRNLKTTICKLRKQGKTLKQIKEQLHCSNSTIAYHLYQATRISTKNRTMRLRKLDPKNRMTAYGHLSGKITQFHRLGKYKKTQLSRNFTTQELIKKIGGSPKCYLTGTPINLSNPAIYSLDHKTPVSRGGACILDNVGLLLSTVNRAKSDKTPEEFIILCKQVLEYNGYSIIKL